MKLSRLFSPAGLAREARELAAARGAGTGFVGLSTDAGMRYLALPARIWAAKNFEFWVFLGALLHRVRPRSLLELGSGRSTIYLSDYASNHGAAFVSVDEDPTWTSLGNTIGRLGGIAQAYVRHVPRGEDGYYVGERLRELVEVPPELVFLDGPAGDRSGFARNAHLQELCGQARVVIVDDVQWTPIYDQMDLIERAGGPRERLYFRYQATPRYDNYLAVLLAPEAGRVAREIVEFFDLPLAGEFTREHTRPR